MDIYKDEQYTMHDLLLQGYVLYVTFNNKLINVEIFRRTDSERTVVCQSIPIFDFHYWEQGNFSVLLATLHDNLYKIIREFINLRLLICQKQIHYELCNLY